jgi:hypothetical protein
VRNELVRELVLIVSTRVPTPPRTQHEIVLGVWANSPALLGCACAAVVGICAMIGARGNTPIASNLTGGAIALLVVCGAWFLWRFLHRSREHAAIDPVTTLFAAQRVSRDEWDTAKRLIEQSRPEFLRMGVSRHFDELCLP